MFLTIQCSTLKRPKLKFSPLCAIFYVQSFFSPLMKLIEMTHYYSPQQSSHNMCRVSTTRLSSINNIDVLEFKFEFKILHFSIFKMCDSRY